MALREQVTGAGHRPASSVRTPFPAYWVVSQLSEMTTTAEVTLVSFGASVLTHATIIRLIIVPALDVPFDKANWWTPRLIAFCLVSAPSSPDWPPNALSGGTIATDDR
jgi:hypothetical protein